MRVRAHCRLFGFEQRDLRQPADEPFLAGELGVEDRLDHFPSQHIADDLACEGQDVDVVVFHCLVCGEDVTGLGGADAFDLVGSNRYTDTGSARQNSSVDLVVRIAAATAAA
jgi:hypothetical protein